MAHENKNGNYLNGRRSRRRLSFIASLSHSAPRQYFNVQALPFKLMFKKKKKELCKKLYSYFNKTVFDNQLPTTMKIDWVRDVTEDWVGSCQLRWREDKCMEKIRSKEVVIKIRTEFVDTPDRVRDTLVHEMCHAAVWLIDENMEDDHGPLWRRWAKHACDVLPDLPIVREYDNYTKSMQILYTCLNCADEFLRNSRHANFECVFCGGPCRSREVRNAVREVRNVDEESSSEE